MKLQNGSSSHFCILAAIFRDAFAADACDRSISELRRSLKKPNNYEFHFSHCPDPIRASFLKCVAQEQFSYYAFVIDKSKLHLSNSKLSDPKSFYEFAVNIVCDNAGELMSQTKVVIDRNGNREFLQRLEAKLRLLKSINGERVVRKVKMEDSSLNNLVQLADMACGAVARSITSSKHTFRDLMKEKGREKRVQCWPK